MWVNIQRITRVAHCANVVWPDLGAVALHAPPGAAEALSVLPGATYLITITDAQGAFASRAVITLHGDRTLSAIDSKQGGPTFFSSQLGAWKFDGKGSVVGRTLDVDFPQSQGTMARLDYIFTFSANDTQVTGTITLTSFPLQGDPLDGDGTGLGEFTFTGTRVTP
jgi:hypothetical protein